MFKTVLTLFRGSVAAAGEELEDRSALLILDQQMRDAAAAVERSKRTLALAIAQDQQEGRRLDAIKARIADLELRAIAALDGGRDDLAREAAQSIAGLEADRDAAMTARTLFAQEIAPAEASGFQRGKPHHRTRSRPPYRPRRGSGARDAPRRRGSGTSLRIHAAGSGEDIEASARAAEGRSGRRRSADRNRCRRGPLATAEKLAEQGFGPRLKSTADDVLARLNAKRTQAASTTDPST